MKKTIIAITMIMILTLSIILTACNPSNNDNGNNGNNGDNGNPIEYTEFNVDYIGSLTADITNATALGIKREAVATDDSNITKTFLYKATEGYARMSASSNETDLSKVTFKKNTNVTEEVYDSEGNLIDSNTTITQDEIPAQINKYLVYYGFTFMQFVPVVEEDELLYYKDSKGEEKSTYIEIRPEDKNLVADSKGIASFDKSGYFSDELHQSFVIDNNTGYIYKIEDFVIDNFDNGLIKSDNELYDIRIDSEDQLEFYTVLQNSTINVLDHFKDKYGNNYIKNDSITTVSGNTQFYREAEGVYCLSNEGYAVFISNDATNVKVMDANLQKQSVGNMHLTFPYLLLTMNICNQTWDEPYVLNHIADGILYLTRPSNQDVFFVKINLETGEPIFLQFISHTGVLGTYCRTFILSYDTLLLWIDWEKDGKGQLYYANVYDPEIIDLVNVSFGIVNQLPINYLFDNNKEELFTQIEENFTKLYSDCQYDSDVVFKTVELSGTTYYIVVLDEDGTPQVIKQSEYIAPEQKVITLQPINR